MPVSTHLNGEPTYREDAGGSSEMAGRAQARARSNDGEDKLNGRAGNGQGVNGSSDITPLAQPSVTDRPNGHSTGKQGVDAASQLRRARLERTVEAEVIPRLLMAHRDLQEGRVAGSLNGPEATEQDAVRRLTELVRTEGEPEAYALIEALRDKGTTVDAVFMQLLAPTARRLGDMWVQDLCSFTEVTSGLWRLQQLMRRLSPAFQEAEERRWTGHKVLLVPVPGEQHTFGLFMVAEFFRRAGWDTLSTPIRSTDQLVATLGHEWFAIVGLSVGSEVQLEKLAATIRCIRSTSQNRAIGVMVGGQVFDEDPGLVSRVGADATAPNGNIATRKADDLLAMLT